LYPISFQIKKKSKSTFLQSARRRTSGSAFVVLLISSGLGADYQVKRGGVKKEGEKKKKIKRKKTDWRGAMK
jgi:hypothetical protein